MGNFINNSAGAKVDAEEGQISEKWRVVYSIQTNMATTYQIVYLWEVIGWSLGSFIHRSIRDPWGIFEVVFSVNSSSFLLAKVTNLILESGCDSGWDRNTLSLSNWEKTPEKSGIPEFNPDPVIGMS